MRAILLTTAAMNLCAGVALAQSAQPQSQSSQYQSAQPSQAAPSQAMQSPSAPQAGQSAQSMPMPAETARSQPVQPQPESLAAQSGPQNAAIKPTDQNNASMPVKGANSFTMAEAKSHIEARGYTQVAGLTKDQNGIWRGTAIKDGKSVPVTLDYQGNVN